MTGAPRKVLSPAGNREPAPRLSTARLGVVCDFAEESWVSMNAVSDMLIEHLESLGGEAPVAVRIRPTMPQACLRIAPDQWARAAHNADRLFSRFLYYPQYLRYVRRQFDLFHVVDHSYAHLATALPRGRCLVTCHDLDAFRVLLEPAPGKRRPVFRAMAERQLDGLRAARIVCCDTTVVRDALMAHGFVPQENLRVVPLGVDPSFSPSPDSDADSEAASLLGPQSDETPEILHVSSTVPRKRIDLLLEIFHRIHKSMPGARLIRVGGPFTKEQQAIVERLSLQSAISVLPFLTRSTLAAVYRRASLVLHPSQAEGFGLPVVEALACGTPVIASDLPVFREVGGDSVTYLPVGEVEEWSSAALSILRWQAVDKGARGVLAAAGVRQASRFTWRAYAQKTAALYQEILSDN